MKEVYNLIKRGEVIEVTEREPGKVITKDILYEILIDKMKKHYLTKSYDNIVKTIQAC